VKARVLDNFLTNTYVKTKGKKIRSQIEIYNYLLGKSTAHAVADAGKKA
jgi:polyphosphate kinase